MYQAELRDFITYLKSQPNTKAAFEALHAPANFVKTGDLSNKSANFKRIVERRLMEWCTYSCGADCLDTTTLNTRIGQQRKKIVEALEREWAAKGIAWVEGDEALARLMSPATTQEGGGDEAGPSSSAMDDADDFFDDDDEDLVDDDEDSALDESNPKRTRLA